MRGKSRYLSVVSAAATLLVIILSQPIAAFQIAEDSFTPSFPIYANGGAGFGAPWTQGGFNAFASRYATRARSLCYPRLDVAGGSVSGEAFPSINGAIRDLAQPLSGTRYVSFLIQPQGTLNDGIFNGFFGFTLNGSLGNDLFIGKSGGGALEEYVLEARGGAGQIASGTATVVGKTALLVVKAQFMAGPDVFTLYMNPAAGRPEPASNVVKTDLDLGAVSKIGIYSTGAFTIDEIRIGTTFADVVPVRDGALDGDFPGCLQERH